MLTAYFDESQRDGGILCVAGYVFAPQQAKKFCKEWSELFAGYRGGLHMRSFAHRTDAFFGISAIEQQYLLVGAADIIHRRMTLGSAVSCNVAEVEQLAPKWIRGFRYAYSLCCHLNMIAIGEYLRQNDSSERVRYVFESGHRHAGETRDFIRNAILNSDVKEGYRHDGDAFLAKSQAIPLQAADLLAWEWAKCRDETLERPIRPMRKSLLALFKLDPKRYKVAHITGKSLAIFMDQIRNLGLLELAGAG